MLGELKSKYLGIASMYSALITYQDYPDWDCVPVGILYCNSSDYSHVDDEGASV